MWNGKSVAVVLPTYKEKNSIREVIESFDKAGFVDEILVVDNNAEPGTVEKVKKTKAHIIKEKKQGYGHAIRRGIQATNADLIVICEPDGSFEGKDVNKLLVYSDDFEMVFGSRTHRPLIQKDSDMTFYKRIGDVLLGRLMTVLFLCNPLTDAGCTLRLTSRAAWKKIASECQSADGIFATEWVAVAAKNGINFMEIPINYRARVGKSLFVASQYTTGTVWGIRKLFCIVKVWIHGLMHKKLYA